MVWVLKSFYGHSYADIAGVLVPLLSADGLDVEQREIMIRAIELARDKNVEFVDAVLALQAVQSGETVSTFDKTDFKRLPAAWTTPE